MHISIKKKILLISISFSLIMGLVVALTSYSIFYHYNKNNLTHDTELNVSHITDTINEDFAPVASLVRWCQINARLLPYQLYKDNSGDSRTLLHERLNDQYNMVTHSNSNNHIQRLVVSNFSDYYIQIVSASYSTTADVPAVIMSQNYFHAALVSNDLDLSMGFVDDPLVRSSKQVLPIIRPIYHPYNNTILGWAFIGLSTNFFTDAIKTYAVESESSFYLTVGDSVYIYENGSLHLLDAPPWNTQKVAQQLLFSDTTISTSTVDGHTRYVTRPLDLPDCYITQSIPSGSSFMQFSSFIYLIGIIVALIVLAGLGYTLYLNRLVNYPIERILERTKKISAGDFSSDPGIEWENEFGDIGRGINELSGSVKQLIDTQIRIENEKRTYEYQMLQSQINPHFIYNTLNSIKWMASIQNATGIPEMTTALSRLLKSIAKDERTRVPLSSELSFLDDYYTIQKYRYGGSITMQVVVDSEELLKNEILRFTLQPIVENAIFHGIEPKGSAGEITIHVYENSSSDVCVDVTDNGVGMDETTIAGLLTDEQKNKSNFFKDIGISNVHKRLQYEYGTSYGLSFTSQLGSYTTATVTLPRLTCEEPTSVIGGTYHV